MCYGADNIKTIRASEVGTYLYCARAWWYGQKGIESSNQAEMTAGAELHRLHGQQVLASSLTRALALILLLVALVLLVAFCTKQVI
jgi:CRISPR/Cas system-associated exonuclease Cas4 (RecB family)